MEKNNEVVNEDVVVENLNEEMNNEIISDEELIEETNISEDGDIVKEFTVKLQEEENKRLRLLADYENFKRRVTLDKEALQKYRSQNILTNLLPVLDNFSRALSLEAKSEEVSSMMTGMEMIYRTLLDALEAEGLVEIEAQDKDFDPNFHQAIMTENDPDKPTGIVLEELQKGYLLKDRVLRPSMVKVNE